MGVGGGGVNEMPVSNSTIFLLLNAGSISQNYRFSLVCCCLVTAARACDAPHTQEQHQSAVAFSTSFGCLSERGWSTEGTHHAPEAAFISGVFAV